MEAASSESMLDRILSQARLKQLPPRHHSVLPLR